MTKALPLRVRRAGPADEAAIQALVRSERLNPTDLRWANFVVACDGEQIVGAVQMRHHRDGSQELGSLVVAPGQRGRGVATRLIDALLAGFTGPVHMVTQRRHAAHFERWGFRPVGALRAPLAVRLNWLIGQSMTLWSLLRRRPARRLAILGRRLQA
jgi:amino-acid N-acetyltransferase